MSSCKQRSGECWIDPIRPIRMYVWNKVLMQRRKSSQNTTFCQRSRKIYSCSGVDRLRENCKPSRAPKTKARVPNASTTTSKTAGNNKPEIVRVNQFEVEHSCAPIFEFRKPIKTFNCAGHVWSACFYCVCCVVCVCVSVD